MLTQALAMSLGLSGTVLEIGPGHRSIWAGRRKRGNRRGRSRFNYNR